MSRSPSQRSDDGAYDEDFDNNGSGAHSDAASNHEAGDSAKKPAEDEDAYGSENDFEDDATTAAPPSDAPQKDKPAPPPVAAAAAPVAAAKKAAQPSAPPSAAVATKTVAAAPPKASTAKKVVEKTVNRPAPPPKPEAPNAEHTPKSVAIIKTAPKSTTAKSMVMPKSKLPSDALQEPRSIRALVHVRGVAAEASGAQATPLRARAHTSIVDAATIRLALPDAGQFQNFTVDGVSWPCTQPREPLLSSHSTPQEGVFMDVAGDCVARLLEPTEGASGDAPEFSNGCLLMYGAKGSGKSFALFGDIAPPKPPLVAPASTLENSNSVGVSGSKSGEDPFYYSKLNQAKRQRAAGGDSSAADEGAQMHVKASEPPAELLRAGEYLPAGTMGDVIESDGLVVRIVQALLASPACVEREGDGDGCSSDLHMAFLRLHNERLSDLVDEKDPHESREITTKQIRAAVSGANKLHNYALVGVKPTKVTSIATAKSLLVHARQQIQRPPHGIFPESKVGTSPSAGALEDNTHGSGMVIVFYLVQRRGESQASASASQSQSSAVKRPTMQRLIVVDLPDAQMEAAAEAESVSPDARTIYTQPVVHNPATTGNSKAVRNTLLTLGASLSDSVAAARKSFPEHNGGSNALPTNFRGSLLTKVLKECMYGPQTFVTIVGCVAARPENLAETHNTLRFIAAIKKQPVVLVGLEEFTALGNGTASDELGVHTIIGSIDEDDSGPCTAFDAAVYHKAVGKGKVNFFLAKGRFDGGATKATATASSNAKYEISKLVKDESASRNDVSASVLRDYAALQRRHVAELLALARHVGKGSLPEAARKSVTSAEIDAAAMEGDFETMCRTGKTAKPTATSRGAKDDRKSDERVKSPHKRRYNNFKEETHDAGDQHATSVLNATSSLQTMGLSNATFLQQRDAEERKTRNEPKPPRKARPPPAPAASAASSTPAKAKKAVAASDTPSGTTANAPAPPNKLPAKPSAPSPGRPADASPRKQQPAAAAAPLTAPSKDPSPNPSGTQLTPTPPPRSPSRSDSRPASRSNSGSRASSQASGSRSQRSHSSASSPPPEDRAVPDEDGDDVDPHIGDGDRADEANDRSGSSAPSRSSS